MCRIVGALKKSEVLWNSGKAFETHPDFPGIFFMKYFTITNTVKVVSVLQKNPK